MIVDTVKEQIEDYPRVHRSRANLAVHIAAIPLLWVGLIAIALGALRLSWVHAAAGVAAVVVSIALQGWGHGREAEVSRPFSGPANFALRLTTEALFVFPRFLLTGGWARAWLGGGRRASKEDAT